MLFQQRRNGEKSSLGAFLRSVKPMTAVGNPCRAENCVSDELFSFSLKGWPTPRVSSTVWFSSLCCSPLWWIQKETEVHKAPFLILTKATPTNRSSNRRLRKRARVLARGRAHPHPPTKCWSPARKLYM